MALLEFCLFSFFLVPMFSVFEQKSALGFCVAFFLCVGLLLFVILPFFGGGCGRVWDFVWFCGVFVWFGFLGVF